MSEYTSPHVEHLVNAANDPDVPPTRQRTALRILSKGGPEPRYDLPRPADVCRTHCGGDDGRGSPEGRRS